jgi:hypothetical protein
MTIGQQIKFQISSKLIYEEELKLQSSLVNFSENCNVEIAMYLNKISE